MKKECAERMNLRPDEIVDLKRNPERLRAVKLDGLQRPWERLHLAITDLATGGGRLRERVLDAYTSHIRDLHPSRFNGCPIEIQSKFEDLRNFVRGIEEEIERNPGSHKALFDHHLYSALEIARMKLDWRKARSLAVSITALYFEVENAITEELQSQIDDLTEQAKPSRKSRAGK